MKASYPPTQNCGSSGASGLDNAEMPEQLDARVIRMLEQDLGVSTEIFARHLATFFQNADPKLVAEICLQRAAPEIEGTRPISMPSQLFQQLQHVSTLCGLPVERVIAILLASNPNDLCSGTDVPEDPVEVPSGRDSDLVEV